MNESNPFQSSFTPGSQAEGTPEVEAVIDEVSHLLAQTKPWVRFLSVLGFIGTGLAVTFFLVSGFLGVGAPGPMELIIMAPMCVLFYLIPSVLLWKYANRINDFLGSANPGSFSVALIAQKSFWKYVGITAAVVLVLYAGSLSLAGLLTAL